jgi:hypothetical protein
VPEPFVYALFMEARASYNRQPEPVAAASCSRLKLGGFLEIRAV